jgi:hypothetical protein
MILRITPADADQFIIEILNAWYQRNADKLLMQEQKTLRHQYEAVLLEWEKDKDINTLWNFYDTAGPTDNALHGIKRTKSGQLSIQPRLCVVYEAITTRYSKMKSVKSAKKGKQEHNKCGERITAIHSLMMKIHAESKTREHELADTIKITQQAAIITTLSSHIDHQEDTIAQLVDRLDDQDIMTTATTSSVDMIADATA